MSLGHINNYLGTGIAGGGGSIKDLILYNNTTEQESEFVSFYTGGTKKNAGLVLKQKLDIKKYKYCYMQVYGYAFYKELASSSSSVLDHPGAFMIKNNTTYTDKNDYIVCYDWAEHSGRYVNGEINTTLRFDISQVSEFPKNTYFCILSTNGNYARMLGYTPNELFGWQRVLLTRYDTTSDVFYGGIYSIILSNKQK